MKNLKISILIITGLFISSTAMAQNSINFFESISNDEPTAGLNDPGTDGGVGVDDPYQEAPIDDYLPLLIIGGVALAYFNRKKIAQFTQ